MAERVPLVFKATTVEGGQSAKTEQTDTKGVEKLNNEKIALLQGIMSMEKASGNKAVIPASLVMEYDGNRHAGLRIDATLTGTQEVSVCSIGKSVALAHGTPMNGSGETATTARAKIAEIFGSPVLNADNTPTPQAWAAADVVANFWANRGGVVIPPQEAQIVVPQEAPQETPQPTPQGSIPSMADIVTTYTARGETFANGASYFNTRTEKVVNSTDYKYNQTGDVSVIKVVINAANSLRHQVAQPPKNMEKDAKKVLADQFSDAIALRGDVLASMVRNNEVTWDGSTPKAASQATRDLVQSIALAIGYEVKTAKAAKTTKAQPVGNTLSAEQMAALGL